MNDNFDRDKVYYESQDVDYLGFLQTKLGDLKGYHTLAYELIQNADDVKDLDGNPGATQIIFDVYTDKLMVSNNGVFREEDFKRIQRIASGLKRYEEGTTGAFGIGFISVYQITDHPEIESSGRHWKLYPDIEDATKRIRVINKKTKGTTFHLPWAFDANSPVRTGLRLQHIELRDIEIIKDKISEAISRSILFLKNLNVLELRIEGKVVHQVKRIPSLGKISIHELKNGKQNILTWKIYQGDFRRPGNALRSLYPNIIDKKKHTIVSIAILEDMIESGRLFAVLPTEMEIPFPFHISADFFPSSDRKRILLDHDVQSHWNRKAIEECASILEKNIENIFTYFSGHPKGYQKFWKFISQVYDGKNYTANNPINANAFASFWNQIEEILKLSPIVYTINGQWVNPASARLLETDPELIASDILVEMGIQVVHPELRVYYNLLQKLGVKLLTIKDIVQAFNDKGLIKPTKLDTAPKFIKEEKKRKILWNLLEVLSGKKGVQDVYLLNACAIAVSEVGEINLPRNLTKANDDTKQIFRYANWLDNSIPSATIPGKLVPEFSAVNALDYLEYFSDNLNEWWNNGQLDLVRLYQWLEVRKVEIVSNFALRERLLKLPIWPTSDQLKPLTHLFIPGDFQDYLGLSDLIDLKKLGGKKEFLQELQVPELNLETYIKTSISKFFEQPNPDHEKIHKLAELLSLRLGEFRQNKQIKEILSKLPLVEGFDNEFYLPKDLYLNSKVINILGDVVTISNKADENLLEFYKWLGVPQEPSPLHIIERIEFLTSMPVKETYHTIVDIFAYLSGRWSTLEEEEKEQYEALKNIYWLSSEQDQDHWYKPNELFAIFLNYLFYTQTHFLGLPRNDQNIAQAAGFLEFLDVGINPSVEMVVKHLIYCAENRHNVHERVYSFLDRNYNAPEIEILKNKACILNLNTANYLRPNQVFWGEHPFGKYRYQLNSDLREFSNLFKRLAIQETPLLIDFIGVIQEISEEFGPEDKQLTPDAKVVLMRCWEELSNYLEDRKIAAEQIEDLFLNQKSVLNSNDILEAPDKLYLEDRPGIASKFVSTNPGESLEKHIILPTLGTRLAIEAAGVLPLGRLIKLALLERSNPVNDDFLAQRISERTNHIHRVVDSIRSSSQTNGLNVDLELLRFIQVSELVIQYSVRVFENEYHSDPESTMAIFVPEENVIYVKIANGSYRWKNIAREIASYIQVNGDVSSLANGIATALEADTAFDAKVDLDILGYPMLQQNEEVLLRENQIVESIGTHDAVEEDVILFPQKISSISLQEDVEDDYDSVNEENIGIPQQNNSYEGNASKHNAGRNITENKDRKSGPQTSEGFHSRGGSRREKEGGTHHDNATKDKKQKHGGKLRSYVTPQSSSETDSYGNSERANEISEVDREGIDAVLRYERAHGRAPLEKAHHNEGYDIESLQMDGCKRIIEVKSLSGFWDSYGVGLSAPQFRKAQEIQENFWLYVVENALSESPIVYPIRNPFNSIQQYLFDEAWLIVADEDTDFDP